MVHADINTGGSSSTVDYVYDHGGIRPFDSAQDRAGKTINGTDVTKYIVDKNRPYAQVLEEQWTNGALSATTSYVYGDALLSRTSNGTPHFYHYDGMGSTRTLTDATGAVTDTYSYDAYGNLLDNTGSTINPYLYRGEQYDDDLSAYYLRARYYQPGIGRFLTTDPVEGVSTDPLSLHRYMYGHCDPVTYIDPSGERVNLLEITAVGAMISAITLPVASNYFEGLQKFYATLGQKYFPDAYMVGITLDRYTKKMLKMILATIGGPNPVSFPNLVSYLTDYVAKAGMEVVLNVSSAEIGFFLYGGVSTPEVWKGKIVPPVLSSGIVFNDLC
jgi:RHS repeat-associated protein